MQRPEAGLWPGLRMPIPSRRYRFASCCIMPGFATVCTMQPCQASRISGWRATVLPCCDRGEWLFLAWAWLPSFQTAIYQNSLLANQDRDQPWPGSSAFGRTWTTEYPPLDDLGVCPERAFATWSRTIDSGYRVVADQWWKSLWNCWRMWVKFSEKIERNYINNKGW